LKIENGLLKGNFDLKVF